MLQVKWSEVKSPRPRSINEVSATGAHPHPIEALFFPTSWVPTSAEPADSRLCLLPQMFFDDLALWRATSSAVCASACWTLTSHVAMTSPLVRNARHRIRRGLQRDAGHIWSCSYLHLNAIVTSVGLLFSPTASSPFRTALPIMRSTFPRAA